MSREKDSTQFDYEAIKPYVERAQQLDDEGIGYNVGRVLRDADEEVFQSFVTLICGFILEPAKAK